MKTQMKTTLSILLALAVLTITPALALADDPSPDVEPEVAVEVEPEADIGPVKRFHDARLFGGLMPTWVHGKGLGPFSNNEWMLLSRIGFEMELGAGFFLGIGYAGGSMSSDVFGGDYTATLDIHEVPVHLRYRYRVAEWLEPYVRVGVGPTFAEGAIKQVAWNGDRIRQQGFGFRANAGIGVEFLLPRKFFHKRGSYDGSGGFSLGIAHEVGYAYRLPVAFDDMKQDGPGGNKDFEKQLPQGSVDLGTLEASGIYYTIDVVMHF